MCRRKRQSVFGDWDLREDADVLRASALSAFSRFLDSHKKNLTVLQDFTALGAGYRATHAQ